MDKLRHKKMRNGVSGRYQPLIIFLLEPNEDKSPR